VIEIAIKSKYVRGYVRERLKKEEYFHPKIPGSDLFEKEAEHPEKRVT